MAKIAERIIQLQHQIKQLEEIIAQSVVEYSIAWARKQRALNAQRCLELIDADLSQLSPDLEVTEGSELLMSLAQQIVEVVNDPNHDQVAVLGELLANSPGKLSLSKIVFGSIMVFLGLALCGLAIAFGITTFGLGIPLGIFVISIVVAVAAIGLVLGGSGGFVIHSGREKSLFTAIQALLDYCIKTNIEPAESVRLESTEAVSAAAPVARSRPEPTVATKSAAPIEPSRPEQTVITKPAPPAVPPRSETNVVTKPAPPAVPPRSETNVVTKPAAPAVPPRSETNVVASSVPPVVPRSEPAVVSKPAACAAEAKPLPAIPKSEHIASKPRNPDPTLRIQEQATAPKLKKEGTSFQILILGTQDTANNVLSSKKEQADNVVKNKKYVISIDDVAIAVLEGLGINYQIEKHYSEQQLIKFAERCVLEAKSYQKDNPIYKQCHEIAFAFYDMALFKASEKAIQQNKKTTENEQAVAIKTAKKLLDEAFQAYRDKSKAYKMLKAEEKAKPKPKQSQSNEYASSLNIAIEDLNTAKKIRDQKKKLIEQKSTAVDSIKSKTLGLISKITKKTDPIVLSEQEVSNALQAYNLAQEDYQAKKLSVKKLRVSSKEASPALALSKRDYELAKSDFKTKEKNYEKLKPNEILEKFTDVATLIIGSKKQGVKLEILNILKKMKECSQQFDYKAKKSYLNLLIDAFKKLQNESVDELDLLAHVALYCLSKSHQDLATHIYQRLALAHYVSNNEALNKYLSKFEPTPIAAPVPTPASIVAPLPVPRDLSTSNEKPITNKSLDKKENARVNLLNDISGSDNAQKRVELDAMIFSIRPVTAPAHVVVPPPPPPREPSSSNEKPITTKTPDNEEKARVNLLDDIRKGVSALKRVEINTQTSNQRSASEIEVIFLNALAKMQQGREDLNSSNDETETDTDLGSESEWKDDDNNYPLSSSSQDSWSGLSSSSPLRQPSTPISGAVKVGPRLFDGSTSIASSSGSPELSRPDPKAVMALLKGKVPQSENYDNDEGPTDDYLSL